MKFSGKVGFWYDDVEVAPGSYQPKVIEKPYRGDILRMNWNHQPVSNQQNDNFTLNNQLSILSDLYLQKNWPSIRYVVWNGTKFKVTRVEPGYPRAILDVGGVYNGATVGETSEETSGSDGTV